MSHIIHIAVKWALAFLVLLLISYLFGGYHLTNLLILSLGVAILSYFLGDLFILPRTGNIIASICDFALTFFILWLMDFILITGMSITSMLYAALIIAVGEFLFHIYLENRRMARSQQ